MRILRWLFVLAFAVGLPALLVGQQAGGSTASAPPPIKAVGTTKHVMDAMIIPASDVIFNVSVEAPKDADGWKTVEDSAIILAESGNLLMLGSRVKDTGEWLKASRAMVDAGEAALKAAQAKDVDAFTPLGEQVLESCKQCHDRYLDKTAP
jgi:hypothetical protein